MTREYCLDCIRESVLIPRKPSGKGVYCTHHVYQRTKKSRLRTQIRDIIETQRYELLCQKGNLERISIVDLGTIAEEYRQKAKEALAYMKALELDRDGQEPYKQEILRLLVIHDSLLRRRRLTAKERYDLALAVDRGDLQSPFLREQPTEVWKDSAGSPDEVPSLRASEEALGRPLDQGWGPAHDE